MQKAIAYILWCFLIVSSCYAGSKSSTKEANCKSKKITICVTRQKIVVDTVSFPNRNYFGVEDSTFFGNKCVIAYVSLGTGQSGYVVYQDKTGNKVALTDGTEGVRVSGIVQLPDLKEGEEFVTYRYHSDIVCDDPVFGIVRKDAEGTIHTVKAWKVSKPDTIEAIVPETINFTESYETDPD